MRKCGCPRFKPAYDQLDYFFVVLGVAVSVVGRQRRDFDFLQKYEMGFYIFTLNFGF